MSIVPTHVIMEGAKTESHATLAFVTLGIGVHTDFTTLLHNITLISLINDRRVSLSPGLLF